jgi:hypothetical protein
MGGGSSGDDDGSRGGTCSGGVGAVDCTSPTGEVVGEFTDSGLTAPGPCSGWEIYLVSLQFRLLISFSLQC